MGSKVSANIDDSDDDLVQVGVITTSPERVRALVDVGNWYCNRHMAKRDVRAHRPTCDFASSYLGERPRPCNCWSLERRP